MRFAMPSHTFLSTNINHTIKISNTLDSVKVEIFLLETININWGFNLIRPRLYIGYRLVNRPCKSVMIIFADIFF